MAETTTASVAGWRSLMCPQCDQKATGAIRDPQAIDRLKGKHKYITCVLVCEACRRLWPARKNPGVPWLD